MGIGIAPVPFFCVENYYTLDKMVILVRISWKGGIHYMAELLESEKSELTLSINSFDEPMEVKGSDAWAKLIANIIFMAPTTMPTDPEMGFDIHRYQFTFIDDKRTEIEQGIYDQVKTYYPDIPLDSVDVSTKTMSNGEPLLIIILSFTSNGEETTSVIAAEKTKGVLNFSIAP